MKRQITVMLLAIVSLGTLYLGTSVKQAAAAEKKKRLRVGVYDSRAIAIAYINSDQWSNILAEKRAELEKAKKDGDTEKVKELEAWGPTHQAKAHLQGFGTAPVHEYIEIVKDKLPQVAQAAGVDAIVSKWEFDYIAADAETIDVTMELAKLFEPREKAYEWIEQMKDKEPISQEELQRLEKEHPH